MLTLQKWWKLGLAIVLLVVVTQVAVSLVARTQRVHAYLVSHLERAFGRPVKVGSFDARILPSPQLYANGVTVDEDPAFGHEYFLRADQLSASLRWFGLLRGHFEFGTLSFSKPSLILVRNSQGRWNLEQWLPPAKGNASQGAPVYGPLPPAPPVNRLQRIEFDEGRINFKIDDDKLAFAFTNVSGSVDQISRGRWQLQLQAQPWRSGVLLQAAGTIRVIGDLAGTSTRLQPAQITLHWSEASLADVFRLFRGQDYGLRGIFALDASAQSDGTKNEGPGDWTYAVQARTRQIHRWDLTERADNPALNLNLKGRWNIRTRTLLADQVVVEGPRSNLRGMFHYAAGSAPEMELRVDSMGIQASDLLAAYRAFQPDIAEGVTAEQYFTGGMILRGWPLELESAALSSSDGVVKVPGLAEAIRIGPVNGGRERAALVFRPVSVVLGGEVREILNPKRRRVALAMDNAADLTFTQDLATHAGSLSVEGNISKVEDFLKLATALGHPLTHGWELSGQATAVTRWEWEEPFKGRWNGMVAFNRASLAVAGLNQPLNLSEARLNWLDGRRVAHLVRVGGFGGVWTGVIEEAARRDSGTAPNWEFGLMVDQLNAAELDRWMGPRARPNWLQRLLRSVFGEGAPTTPASELVRRVDAEGELRILRLTIEKLKFENVLAKGSLRNLKLRVPEAEAEWAGGKVLAKMDANFLPRPSYGISVDLDHVNLAKLPTAGRMVEHLSGTASGNLELKTKGVGRDELLQNLNGRGAMHLKKVELRGWDIPASVADGAARAGNSQWPAGECAFLVRDRNIVLQLLQLDAGREQTSVEGTLSFASDADLSVSTLALEKTKAQPEKPSGNKHVLKISGPIDGPRVTLEKTPEPRLVN
jgi:AsmA-like protein